MALERFLNPKNDLAFKRIFGSERNQDILIHFLNDILKLSKSPIQTIKFLPTVQIPEVAAQRMSAIDVLCEDQDGKRFIVEMQVESEPGFEKRAQYYAAKAYVEQRGKEHDYADLKSITFLAITSHTLFPNKDAYLSQHHMLDIETHEQLLVSCNISDEDIRIIRERLKALLPQSHDSNALKRDDHKQPPPGGSGAGIGGQAVSNNAQSSAAATAAKTSSSASTQNSSDVGKKAASLEKQVFTGIARTLTGFASTVSAF